MNVFSELSRIKDQLRRLTCTVKSLPVTDNVILNQNESAQDASYWIAGTARVGDGADTGETLQVNGEAKVTGLSSLEGGVHVDLKTSGGIKFDDKYPYEGININGGVNYNYPERFIYTSERTTPEAYQRGSLLYATLKYRGAQPTTSVWGLDGTTGAVKIYPDGAPIVAQRTTSFSGDSNVMFVSQSGYENGTMIARTHLDSVDSVGTSNFHYGSNAISGQSSFLADFQCAAGDKPKNYYGWYNMYNAHFYGGVATANYMERINWYSANYFKRFTSTLTLDTNIGFYAAPAKVSGRNITDSWAFYNEGADDKNYFAGNTLIGSATDDGINKLQVTGDANVTGLINGGSITGIFRGSMDGEIRLNKSIAQPTPRFVLNAGWPSFDLSIDNNYAELIFSTNASSAWKNTAAIRGYIQAGATGIDHAGLKFYITYPDHSYGYNDFNAMTLSSRGALCVNSTDNIDSFNQARIIVKGRHTSTGSGGATFTPALTHSVQEWLSGIDGASVAKVTNAGKGTFVGGLNLPTSVTPTSTADTIGVLGDITFDDDFGYKKTAAGWKRFALSTF